MTKKRNELQLKDYEGPKGFERRAAKMANAFAAFAGKVGVNVDERKLGILNKAAGAAIMECCLRDDVGYDPDRIDAAVAEARRALWQFTISGPRARRDILRGVFCEGVFEEMRLQVEAAYGRVSDLSDQCYDVACFYVGMADLHGDNDVTEVYDLDGLLPIQVFELLRDALVGLNECDSQAQDEIKARLERCADGREELEADWRVLDERIRQNSAILFECCLPNMKIALEVESTYEDLTLLASAAAGFTCWVPSHEEFVSFGLIHSEDCAEFLPCDERW